MPSPADCTTKEEIRAEIDRLDRELLTLMGERFAYIRRMAELKREPGEAYDAGRVDEVLAKVAAEARRQGLDPALMESLWRRLIEWNVAFERRTIGRDREH